MARKITVSATIDGFNDEAFSAPKLGHHEVTQETVIPDFQPQNVLTTELRWGGECRVELRLIGQQLDDGAVRIDGNAKLFEGASEDTNDLDGEIDFTFVVPPGQSVTHDQSVTNKDEGGDYADIQLKVVNVMTPG